MNMTTESRVLKEGDEETLDAFLATYNDSSMFLRSNLRSAGFADVGKVGQGTYVGRFVTGNLVAVAAHYWNGNVILQASTGCSHLIRFLVGNTSRPIHGLLGPWDQVVEARDAAGLASAPSTIASCDDLLALELSTLIVPEVLVEGRVKCRHSRDAELDLLTHWFVAYSVEALGVKDDRDLHESCRARVERNHEKNTLWVLTHEERPVAMTSFNAELPDCVQVGGVWTPPEQRGRGYARSVVAASLLEVREQGVKRATLFTDSEPGRRAYRAIGFELVGDYGIVLFEEPEVQRS